MDDDPGLLPKVLGKTESHARALTKAVTWRAIGTLDTFMLSWIITGHPGNAGAIAGVETFTKIFLYYLHERAWRLVHWNPNGHSRSILKAFTWRAVGGLDTFMISWVVTGSGKYAISIASVEVMTKIGLYYAHERVWRRVKWGRLEPDPVPPAEPVVPA